MIILKRLKKASERVVNEFNLISVITFNSIVDVVNIQLNCSETHLILMTRNLALAPLDYALSVYDLRTVSFNSGKKKPQVGKPKILTFLSF